MCNQLQALMNASRESWSTQKCVRLPCTVYIWTNALPWSLYENYGIIKNVLQGTKKINRLRSLLWFPNDRGERKKQRHKHRISARMKTENRHCHSPDTSVNLVAGKEAICMQGGRKEGGCNPATSCWAEVSLPVFQCSMRGPRDTQKGLSRGVSVPLASEMHPVVIN